MEERSAGRVFGEIAEVYDRVRKPYPAALFDDVLEYAGGATRALEVGAGTGRATVAFAEKGVSVVAVEPDPRMAEVLRRRVARVDGVEVERCTFEEYRPAERFGLMFSAEAWHWTTPETRWELTRAALADGGTLALFWNNERIDEPSVQQTFVEVFARLAPTVTIKDLAVPAERAWQQWPGDELAATGGFGDLTSRHYLVRQRVPAADYLGLTRTRSQFRMLPAATQEEVTANLAEVLGDELTIATNTTLLLARRK
jgi:SAM-dependent methyltransferase